MVSLREALIDLSTPYSARALVDKLRAEPSEAVSLSYELKTTKINSTPRIKQAVRQLLDGLNIKPAQQSRYENAPISVDDLIHELRDLPKAPSEQAIELDAFVVLVDKSAGLTWRSMLFMVGLVFVAGLLPLIFPVDLTMIQKLLAGALLIPAVSLFYTLGVLVYTLFPHLFFKQIPSELNEEDTVWFRFKHKLFALSGFAMNALGYALFLAAATTGPIIASISVIASFLFVIQEAVYLILHPRSKIEPSTKMESLLTDLNINQVQARHDVNYEKRKNDILINFTVATALAVLVVIWSFVPGGLLVTIPVVAAMGMAYLVKYQAGKRNAQEAKGQLEAQFKVLESEYEIAVKAENKPKKGTTYARVPGLKIKTSAREHGAVVDVHHAVGETLGWSKMVQDKRARKKKMLLLDEDASSQTPSKPEGSMNS